MTTDPVRSSIPTLAEIKADLLAKMQQAQPDQVRSYAEAYEAICRAEDIGRSRDDLERLSGATWVAGARVADKPTGTEGYVVAPKPK